MNDDKNLTIRVKVLEKIYPIEIQRSEEEDIRKAVSLVKEMVNSFIRAYPSDKTHPVLDRDYLSFVAVQMALKVVKLQKQKDNAVLEISQEIDELLKEMDKRL